MKKLLIATISLIFISGCGESTTETKEGEDLLESQREAMEQAEQLEEDLQEALDERMREVDGN